MLYPDLRNASGKRISGNRASRWVQKLRIEGVGQWGINGDLAALDSRDGSIREDLVPDGNPGLRQSISHQRIHSHEGYPRRGNGAADENTVAHLESRRVTYIEAPRSSGDEAV